jgi:large subunit ribosomal protein L21
MFLWYNGKCRLCKALKILFILKLPFIHSEPKNEREVLFVFAIVQIGGKQYKVQEGDIVFVEKLDSDEGEPIEFTDVLAVSGENGFTTGNPTVAGAMVGATVLKQGKDKKIYVMTYKSKKNVKRKMGHRQPHTKIQITHITA